jgi:hypothetical protein
MKEEREKTCGREREIGEEEDLVACRKLDNEREKIN